MIRVKITDAAVISKPYEFTDEKSGEKRSGTSHKQNCRYYWGENSSLGTISVDGPNAGYPVGDYDVDPDSFEMVSGTLRTRKQLRLVAAKPSTLRAAS